jgi:hypothetical protein
METTKFDLLREVKNIGLQRFKTNLLYNQISKSQLSKIANPIDNF